MSLNVSRGNPQLAGHYAVCVGDMSVPTEIRLWDKGWLPDLSEPQTSGEVIGWVGPLPVVKFESGKPRVMVMEYDPSAF